MVNVLLLMQRPIPSSVKNLQAVKLCAFVEQCDSPRVCAGRPTWVQIGICDAENPGHQLASYLK